MDIVGGWWSCPLADNKMCMSDQAYVSRIHSTHCYCIQYVCVEHIMQSGAGTWKCAWKHFHAFKKHVCVLRCTMWSIVARNAQDNRESLSRVGSRKVRGTEWGENIQFNFETASAQSTNTKASLQADPCWRLQLIHTLQSRGERTSGRKVQGVGRRHGDHQVKEVRWHGGWPSSISSALKERV